MKTTGKEVNQPSVLDPLWEFILDDYDDLDGAPVRTKPRFFLRKEKKAEEQSGLFVTLFDTQDDFSEMDTSSQHAGWLDSRDESEIPRSRSAKSSSSRRRSQLTENSGVDNSIWDLFGGSEQTKTKTATKTSSEAASKPSAPKKESQLRRSRNSSTMMRDASVESSSQTNTTSGKKQKGGIFRRFRKQQHLEEETEKAEGTAPQGRQRRETKTDYIQSKPVQPTPYVEQLKKDPTKKRSSNTVNDLDPIQMFLEVAKNLDPFGSDHDSDSDSSTSGETRQTDDGTEAGTEATDSVASEVHNVATPAASNVTEIRLNFKPVREQDEPELPGETSSIIDAPQEEQALSESDSDSDSVLRSVSISVTNKETDAGVDRAEAEVVGEDVPLHRKNAITRNMFPSDEMKRVSGCLTGSTESIKDCEEKSKGTLEKVDFNDLKNGVADQQTGFKRLFCCSDKKGRAEIFHQLQRADAKEVFPATRMISDDNAAFSAVTGKGADYVNGVMGVPSDRFLKTNGPQSLYAYDYNTNEHMDVFYAAPSSKPRASMALRQLGRPPVLDAMSSGDEVIIQVEASTVSETDCIIRKGNWWGSRPAPISNTPGADMVGKVFQIGQKAQSQYQMKPRQTVLALTNWGGNSRFMSIHPDQLVKVPDGIDPAEAACLPEMYLSAFQTLHTGQIGAMRYRPTSLRGKSVLIVGSMANSMGKTMIELALSAGVANVYATAKKKHWKTLISFGIMPLSLNPLEWISRVEGTIDLVLASNGACREDVTPLHYRALSPKDGQLILCGHRAMGNDLPIDDLKKTQPPIACSKNKALTRMMNKSHTYDVYEQWDNNLDMCKKDLDHLLVLLKRGTIKPTILDRLPLNKVGRAHELLESKRLSGFLVCEPWLRSKKRAVYL